MSSSNDDSGRPSASSPPTPPLVVIRGIGLQIENPSAPALTEQERRQIQQENRELCAKLKANIARRGGTKWLSDENLGISHEEFLERLASGAVQPVASKR